jgi:hypothetical protein
MTVGLGILEPIFHQRNYAPGLGAGRDTFNNGANQMHIATVAMPKDMTTRDYIVMMWAGTIQTDGDDPGYKVEIADEAGNSHSTAWEYNKGSSMAFRVADCTRYTAEKAVSTDLRDYCTGSGSGGSAADAHLSRVDHYNANTSEGLSTVYGFTMFLRRG